MSSTAITPKRLARDIGVIRRDCSYLNSQLCLARADLAPDAWVRVSWSSLILSSVVVRDLLKAFAQEIGASVGKAANIEVRDGKLVVEIAKPKRRRCRYTLEHLVAGIKPENRHLELEWGPPIGNEVW
jgi:antitoxin MazE